MAGFGWWIYGDTLKLYQTSSVYGTDLSITPMTGVVCDWPTVVGTPGNLPAVGRSEHMTF